MLATLERLFALVGDEVEWFVDQGRIIGDATAASDLVNLRPKDSPNWRIDNRDYEDIRQNPGWAG